MTTPSSHRSLNFPICPVCCLLVVVPTTAAFQANTGLVRGLCCAKFRRNVDSVPGGSFEGPSTVDDVQQQPVSRGGSRE